MKFHTSTETGSGMATTMVSDSSENAVDNLHSKGQIVHTGGGLCQKTLKWNSSDQGGVVSNTIFYLITVSHLKGDLFNSEYIFIPHVLGFY